MGMYVGARRDVFGGIADHLCVFEHHLAFGDGPGRHLVAAGDQLGCAVLPDYERGNGGDNVVGI